MITTQLLRPESIVVVGASNNVHKPGGAILKNLINGGYQGELRAVNPKDPGFRIVEAEERRRALLGFLLVSGPSRLAHRVLCYE